MKQLNPYPFLQNNPFLPIIQSRVLQFLHKGIIPWQQGFSPYGVARTYIDKRFITGLSWLLCNFTTTYPLPYYLRWEQIQQLNGRVQKHTKAEYIYYQKAETMKRFPIYNISCVNGLTIPIPKPNTNQQAVYANIERWLRPLLHTIPTTPSLQKLASWDPLKQVIRLPVTFKSTPKYYWYLFKALLTWTDSEQAIGRTSISNLVFRYPIGLQQEQLVCELGAAYLCGYFKVYTPWELDAPKEEILDWYYYIYRHPTILITAIREMRTAVAYLFKQQRATHAINALS